MNHDLLGHVIGRGFSRINVVYNYVTCIRLIRRVLEKGCIHGSHVRDAIDCLQLMIIPPARFIGMGRSLYSVYDSLRHLSGPDDLPLFRGCVFGSDKERETEHEHHREYEYGNHQLDEAETALRFS